MKASDTLEINLLGELSLRRCGAALALPPSRKTRGLLAYRCQSGPAPAGKAVRTVPASTGRPAWLAALVTEQAQVAGGC